MKYNRGLGGVDIVLDNEIIEKTLTTFVIR